MGKVKHRRHRTGRYRPNPVLSNSSNPPEAGVEGLHVDQSENLGPVSFGVENEDVSPAGLKIISEKISHSVMEERLNGLNSLAALALDDVSATVIANNKIIRKVTRLLKDESADIRLVAAGALRNISAGGSDEVVEAMVQQDVMSPLADLLNTYKNPWSPMQTDLGMEESRETDPMTNIFVHATHFLWNLCECSAEAVKIFNQEGLIHVLIKHLDPSNWGYNLAIAAAECILCVSENNSSTQSVLLPIADSLLLFISRPTDKTTELHFATLIAGILMNINYCTTSGNDFQQIVQLLSTTLEADAVKHTNEYASQVSSCGVTPLLIPQDLEHLILAQQLALEILSNICCSEEDEDEEWEDAGNMSEDECEEDRESMDVTNKSNLSPEVQESIIHFRLFEKSLTKVQYPEQNVCQILQNLKYGPSLLSKLSVLQVRALLSLQNMIDSLEVGDIGGSELMYSTWVQLGTMVFKDSCPENMLEAATGTMRAIMGKLSEHPCDKLSEITHQDIKVILEAGISCEIASVRANLTRMIGTLGCLLVTMNNDESLYGEEKTSVLSVITEFLLKVASSDEKLWVSAEALDVIIDLYSDDKTDKLASRTCLMDGLKSIQPNFRSNKQKKKLGDHRALVVTVKDNLSAFIKYKSPRAAKHRNT